MFYGDAVEFPVFMTAFESLIESKVEDACERLYFLGQCTSGKAKEVINDCIQRKSERPYNEAKGLVKRQLGYPFLNDCKRPTSPSCLLLAEQTMARLSTISLLLWTKKSLL